ncbi:DNAj protein [Cryptosporidium sp. chipmunk genotype I]|uniref:DNAj protein n=1 Tax=Cryptosporidium sp. chipmunk genotype I TaxID=1280935 RepID=UPI003519E0D0|nr:DNAj protein [Cryptosporidium sp. chipmunk genotype I]
MFSERLKEYQKYGRVEKDNLENILKKESKRLREIEIGIGRFYKNNYFTRELSNKSLSSISSTSSSKSSNSNSKKGCENGASNKAKLMDISSKISCCSSSVVSNDSKTKSDYVQTLRNQNSMLRRRELISDDQDFSDSYYFQGKYKKRNQQEDDYLENQEFRDKSPMNEYRKLNRRVLISHKYYDILELQPGSSIENIKKAYRKKASKLHPDKQRSGNLEQKEKSLIKFRQVQESYEFLSNPNKKEVYDEYGDDILKYGFLDYWNEMKGIFESKAPNNNEMHININNKKSLDNQSDWEVFWQELLVNLFFKPILNKNSIELRDLPPMNMSVTNYKTLINNSYTYLKKLLSMPKSLFGNPIVMNLDSIDSGFTNDNSPILKKGLFSRLINNSNSSQNTELILNNFVNVQIVGSNPNNLVINKDTVSLLNTFRNKSSVNDAFGIIFCENKQGWTKFLNLAKKEFENKRENEDNLIFQKSNNFKRRLKEIQAEFDWIILVFLSEEQLPSQDQELLLDYYNIRDELKEFKDSEDVTNLDIIEEKVDGSHAFDLFPCLVHKPKKLKVMSKFNSDISSYSRPSSVQIIRIIKQLELLSNFDYDDFHYGHNKHSIFNLISNKSEEAPYRGEGGKGNVVNYDK